MFALLGVLYFGSAVFGQIVAPPGYIWKPGPLIEPTKGEVWPLVQSQTKSNDFFVVQMEKLKLVIKNNTCNILTEAIDRYKNIIYRTGLVADEYKVKIKKNFKSVKGYAGNLDTVTISLASPCSDADFPSYEMNEEYKLNVSKSGALLFAESIWGILRGLETLSQLVYLADDLKTLLVNATEIHDYPRFPHRGLLLDTSRHYIGKQYLYRFIDALSYNKFNVFHFHITDDYSFPYVSKTYPELSEKGAFHKGMTYDQKFIKDIQIYAQRRGIRVLPEFDTPGHTLSWGLGNPEILTPCYGENGKPTGGFGPIDPTKDSTYNFLFKLLDEVEDVFLDKYLHIGGDEVDFSCWKSNPNINDWMKKHGMEGDYVALQSYFTQKVVDYIANRKQIIVWEEVFTTGVTIPKETVVEVWVQENCTNVMNKVTKAGFRAITSCCWYLDYLAKGGDWMKFYACDATNFPGTAKQKALVYGGEAAMWAEVVDDTNLEPRVWPRASAVAERLWSPERDGTDIYNILEAAHRLEEHACRMNTRGIRTQPPTGPSVCLTSTSTNLPIVPSSTTSGSIRMGHISLFSLFILLIFHLLR